MKMWIRYLEDHSHPHSSNLFFYVQQLDCLRKGYRSEGIRGNGSNPAIFLANQNWIQLAKCQNCSHHQVLCSIHLVLEQYWVGEADCVKKFVCVPVYICKKKKERKTKVSGKKTHNSPCLPSSISQVSIFGRETTGKQMKCVKKQQFCQRDGVCNGPVPTCQTTLPPCAGRNRLTSSLARTSGGVGGGSYFYTLGCL